MGLMNSQILEVVRRYRGGERAKTLGEEFGVHTNTVLRYVKLNQPTAKRIRRSVDREIIFQEGGYDWTDWWEE